MDEQSIALAVAAAPPICCRCKNQTHLSQVDVPDTVYFECDDCKKARKAVISPVKADKFPVGARPRKVYMVTWFDV